MGIYWLSFPQKSPTQIGLQWFQPNAHSVGLSVVKLATAVAGNSVAYVGNYEFWLLALDTMACN